MEYRKTWNEFRETKLLWWINRILHTFGWAIVCDIENGEIKEVYPARVKYRGFDYEAEEEGFIGITSYIAKEAQNLLNEIKS